MFIESLRFAGELDADHTLLATPKRVKSEGTGEIAPAKPAVMTPSHPLSGELETYYLTLNATAKRRVIVQAPPSVTSSELKRIQDWLSFQLLVDENKETEPVQ